MEYTREFHEQYKGKIQELLNLLIEIAKQYDWQPGMRQIMFYEDHVGLCLEISYTAPFGLDHEMAFFSLDWGHFCRIEFQRDTGLVDDSTRWMPNGSYGGSGHVQCWHSWMAAVLWHYDDLRDRLQKMRNQLQFADFDDSKMLR